MRWRILLKQVEKFKTKKPKKRHPKNLTKEKKDNRTNDHQKQKSAYC